MADYQLTATENCVIRTADGAGIPNDPANTDYQIYLKWIEDGGVPDPYVPPPEPEPAPPADTAQDAVLLNHENRIRGFEGREPISLQDFTREMARR
jgi:hypothetical protein